MNTTRNRRRVSVIALGGTAASVTATAGAGVTPRLGADELTRDLPGLGDIEVRTLTLRAQPSAHVTFAELLELAQVVEAELARSADGAVVVQGTDTLEESAFALWLLHAGAQPVVFTGAMRSAAAAGADGAANIQAAIQVAASGDAAGHGVLVVMDDEVHSAARVSKTSTFRTGAFRSVGEVFRDAL